MTVIELGLVKDGDEDEEPADRQPLRRGDLRRWLAAAVGVFCLLTVTGSAVPEPSGLPTLWSAPFSENTDQFQLADGVVYLLRTTAGAVLSAHDARTGVELWKTGDVPDASTIGLVRGGIVLLPADHASAQYYAADGTAAYTEYNRQTVALDASTGRELWRTSGDLQIAADDHLILAEHTPAGAGLGTLRAVRLRDGGRLWSRPGKSYENSLTTDDPLHRRLVAVTPDGVVEVLDMTDGHLVTSKKIPWRQSQVNSEYTSAMADGDHLFVSYIKPRQTAVVAYQMDTMRELWRLDQDAESGILSCGPVLCVSNEHGTGGYDRETGAIRWRIDGMASGFPTFHDKLLVNTDNSGVRYRIVDQATGRKFVDLGEQNPVWNPSGEESPYFLRRSTEMPGYTAVSYLQEATDELFMRGKITGVQACQSDRTLLACISEDQHLLVTDVG